MNASIEVLTPLRLHLDPFLALKNYHSCLLYVTGLDSSTLKAALGNTASTDGDLSQKQKEYVCCCLFHLHSRIPFWILILYTPLHPTLIVTSWPCKMLVGVTWLLVI